MATNNLKTASVLAFERKLANSDALMFAGNWQYFEDKKAWKPIAIQEKSVRGTISNRLKNAVASNSAKLDAEIQKANLQRVDLAALPFDCDSLKMTFSLRVLGDLANPSACNSPDYQKALDEKIAAYTSEHQFKELASRYAENLANGRFLWRNRIGAEAVKVRITHPANQALQTPKKVWEFDALQFNLRQFGQLASPEKSAELEKLAQLADVIAQGLLGKNFALLEVEAFVRLGAGQEVFPSQELVLDSGNNKDKKSKYLYQVADVAALHSQKIGNALRTIDTWYPQAAEFGAIAVEPYGSVTNRGVAYRQPKDKTDFYNLLDAWILKNNAPSAEQQHYVIATLIRGGVFGDAAKPDSAAKE